MIETVESSSGEIVTLEEAKAHLGVWDSALDTRVKSDLAAARAYCEGWGEITLRLSTARTVKCDSWPSGGWVLKHPPVTGVTSIQYYDADNTQQTLSTSLYRTHLTEAGYGVVSWADEVGTFDLPDLSPREDAVTVSYGTGWVTADAAPDDLKAAIRLTLRSIYGEDDTRQLGYAKDAALALLTGRAAWTYA